MMTLMQACQPLNFRNRKAPPRRGGENVASNWWHHASLIPTAIRFDSSKPSPVGLRPPSAQGRGLGEGECRAVPHSTPTRQQAAKSPYLSPEGERAIKIKAAGDWHPDFAVGSGSDGIPLPTLPAHLRKHRLPGPFFHFPEPCELCEVPRVIHSPSGAGHCTAAGAIPYPAARAGFTRTVVLLHRIGRI